MSYGKWIGDVTRRVERLEQDSAADKRVRDYKRWVVPVIITVLNLLIAGLGLYMSHH
jgi:hypothetical protein